MSFESSFYTLLSGNAALVALVAERIYPVQAPQGVDTPYLCWQRVASEPQNGLGGFTGQLERVRVQVDAYATEFDPAIAIAAAVRTAVQAATTPIRGITINEMDFYESETRLFRRMLELSLFYRSGS